MTIAATATRDEPADAVERVSTALDQLAAGYPIVVLDDEDRENEADLVFAAERATPSLVAFTVRHTSGFLCIAITAERADDLELPPMAQANHDQHGTAYSVTVDAKSGVTTGISATDRARTTSLLAAANTTPDELVRPGHTVPLRARAGGVLARRGHTEAAVDLTAMAGLRPAGGLCELVSSTDPTGMARAPEARTFAQDHGLCVLSIDDIIAYRMQRERVVERCADVRLPLQAGPFRAVAYRSRLDGQEHLALVCGQPGDQGTFPVHIHRECALSIVAASPHCACRSKLDAALESVARQGEGVVVLLRNGPRLATCNGADAREEQRANAMADAILTDLGA